jgi:hypothetical protein
MRPEAVEYVLDNFESAVLKALDDLAGNWPRCAHAKINWSARLPILPSQGRKEIFRPHFGLPSLRVSARSAT